MIMCIYLITKVQKGSLPDLMHTEISRFWTLSENNTGSCPLLFWEEYDNVDVCFL